MKNFVILLVLLCLTAIYAENTYTTKYDNIDIDEILHNERLYKNYFSCLTNKGKCTPDGKELKESLPDALATACAKCTEKQKEGTEKVIKFMIENKPDDYEVLEQLYDPEGTYRKKYKEEAKKFGIPDDKK